MELPNLYKTLSKYGAREAENYLTESFVFLIKVLLDKNELAGLRLLNRIAGLKGKVCFDNPDLIQVSTQVSVERGIVDIELKSGSEILVYIEVKHAASLAPGQLEAYTACLKSSGVGTTSLVLLTRSLASTQETTLPHGDYQAICWYDVHNELRSIRAEAIGGASDFLIDEFLSFLEDKQMSLKRVGWEYMNGVPSMIALVNMLEVAIFEVVPNVRLKRTAGWTWIGYYLEDDYFCGFYYTDPLVIVYQNNRGTNPTSNYPPLDLPKEHFFSLSQAEQLECLVSFIQQCVASKAECEAESVVV